WNTTVPSRFLDELPEAHVEVKEAAGGAGGFGMSGYGPSRFDEMNSFGSNYGTPGWQRAQARKGSGGFDENGARRYVADSEYVDDDPDTDARENMPPRSGRVAGKAGRVGSTPKRPLTIEGELIAKSTGTASA